MLVFDAIGGPVIAIFGILGILLLAFVFVLEAFVLKAMMKISFKSAIVTATVANILSIITGIILIIALSDIEDTPWLFKFVIFLGLSIATEVPVVMARHTERDIMKALLPTTVMNLVSYAVIGLTMLVFGGFG